MRGVLCVGFRGRGFRVWCFRRGFFKVLESVSAMYGVFFGVGCRGFLAFVFFYVFIR